MPKSLFILTIICTFLVTIMFFWASPSSARGFYYVIWLSFTYFVWKNRETLRIRLQKSPLGDFVTFLLLGIAMILMEETFAGVTVNILSVTNLATLISKIPPYYENNILLLPGFIIGWYLLLKRYYYTQKEFFILGWFFGLFSEKIYIHVMTLPIIGIPLIPVTMFTYIGIILLSYLSLATQGEKILHPVFRYSLGFFFPIVTSIPLILIHSYLSGLGYIDPSILAH